MLNSCTLMGRLTKNPELRRTASGTPVANFRLAVDRDYTPNGENKKTDFIDCVAWRGTGEFVNKYFTQGRMVVVSGRLEMREWTDKEGNKRVSAEINVENAYFADSKPAAQNDSSRPTAAPAAAYATAPAAGDFAPIDYDDAELPF